MDITNGNEGAPAVVAEAEIDLPEPEPEAAGADVAAVMDKKVWGKLSKCPWWPAEVNLSIAWNPWFRAWSQHPFL